MSRQIISEALNGIRDEYITEVGARLGLLAATTAAVGAAGAASAAAVDSANLYSLSTTEAAVKTGFGAWVAKGGWIALVAGAVAAAGIATGAFFLSKSGGTPPVESENVTTEEQEESLPMGDVTEEPTEGESEHESEYESDAGNDFQPQEDPRYFQFPLADPDDTVSYVSLPDPSAEGYQKLIFSIPTTDGDTLKEVFTLPIPAEGERNILVLFCEGIIDPSYQTGSSYYLIYFIESTFIEQIAGTEKRTVQMTCGRVDFYDTPIPVPSGNSVSHTYYHADKTGSATVTYSDADRESVLARNRHNNLNALDHAEELLYTYGQGNNKLTVLYSYIDGVEILNTPVESLPDFPYNLFRTHALP